MKDHLRDLLRTLERDAVSLLNRKRMILIGDAELVPLPDGLRADFNLQV